MSKLKDIAYITKLAGFEHTKYIQGNCTHEKQNDDDKPLFIGKTVRNGNIDKNFDWFISSKISEELPRSQLNKKCIVLPYVGSVGDLAIFDGTYKAHLGSNIAKLELNDNCEFSEEFIYYYLKSPFGQKNLLKDIQGAVQKNITMDAIRNVEIPNIEKSKQTKIVNMLLGLDKKILNNNNIISELESMAKTIYDYWFLQYEFPNEEGKPYKSSGGKMVYNESLKREIPIGWTVGTLSDIANFIMGQSPKSSAYNELGKGLPLINGAVELTSSGIDINKYTTEYNRVCKVNDLLFCIRATLGNIQFADREYCLGRGVASARPKEEMYVEYAYQVLNYMISYFESVLSGSIIVGMTKDNIADFTTIIPPKDIMDKYHNVSKDSLITCRRLKDENKELQNLRDYLLPLLMNGQVSFKS